jgi:hypothetical protein
MYEKWVDIINYEGLYKISNLGRVKSCNRLVRNKSGRRYVKEKMLKPTIDKCGYYKVNLNRHNKRKTFKIHKLVADQFLIKDQCVNHIDGNKLNNTLDNLEYVTYSKNSIHAREMGLVKSKNGENSPLCKIDDQTIDVIKKLSKSGATNRQIGKYFGVSYGWVGKVVRGERR